MQLLDSCALPQIQFASLSILLQLHLNDEDGDSEGGHRNDGAPTANGSGVFHATTEEITDGNKNIIIKDANKYAGGTMSPTSRKTLQQQTPPRYAVLKESLSALSPLTRLPEGAFHQCLTSLQVKIMEEFNMRDDFIGVGAVDNYGNDYNDDGSSQHRNPTAGSVNQVIEGHKDDPIQPTTIRRGSSRVRFHDDTKEGSVENPLASTNNIKDEERITTTNNNNDIVSFASQLVVRAYQPPTHHMNCSMGMTLFYVAVPVEDVTMLAANVDKDRKRKNNQSAAGTFQNCLAVLLPEITLQDLSQMRSNAVGGGYCQERNAGIVLLTVGITGPAYDLFGVSSTISVLPMRLRECMATLAVVKTSPIEKNHTILSKPSQIEQPQAQQATPRGKKKSRVGKEASVAVITNSQQKQTSLSNVASYDSEYFHRLYMALLATLIDDEDYLLRDNDSIATIGPTSTRLTSKSPIAGGAAIADSPAKRKRFTFSRSSRKTGKNVGMDYAESSDLVSGVNDGGVHPEANSEPTSIFSNADIVRQMAQQLEILSLVEDDMALPKYSQSPSGAKSPRRVHGGTGISTGRFGRSPMASDLAGFEYRHPSYQQLKMRGGGSSSISGTASTSIMGNSASDDVSIRTGGDETITTLSSRFSSSSLATVPTLSKSKRDSTSSLQKSSRSRFLQKKKQNEKGAGVSPARDSLGGERPPLFPHQLPSQNQPSYDPFSVNDDDDYAEDAKSAVEDQSIASDSPVVNYQIPNTPKDDDTATAKSSMDIEHTPRTPEDAPGVGDESTAPLSPKMEIYGNNVPVAHSSSEDSRLQTNLETTPSEEREEDATNAYARQLEVLVAVTEDLTCEYHRSILSSLSVEGTVQVRVQSRCTQESPLQQPQPSASVPFYLVVQDQSGHIKTLQENKKYAENSTQEGYESPSDVTYIIQVPEEEEYAPVLRYKCDSSLRPVPIVSIEAN